MASASQLEQISQLVERLKPLRDKRRGMPIDPDEWNLLVASIIDSLEIDRIQEQGGPAALEERFARREHEHVGQVRLDWLDAELQSRLASGGGGSLTTRIAIADAQRLVEGLGSETARLTAVAEEQQRRMDRASATELSRAAQLRTFAERFESIEGLRPTITELGAHVEKVNNRLGEVLEFREKLVDADGQPIDVAALVSEQAILRRLAANFNGVDGNPVPIRDLELRIAELEDALDPGAAGRLDARIAAVVAASEARLQQSQNEHDAALAGKIDETLAGTRAELQGMVDGRLTEVDTRVAQLSEDVINKLPELVREAIGGALDEFREQFKGDLERLGAEFDRSLRVVRINADARLRRIEERLQLPPIDPRDPREGGGIFVPIRDPEG